MEQKEFNEGLQRYMMKCELEYRAKTLPGGSCVDWLAEHCSSTQEIADFLRKLGFETLQIEDTPNCSFVMTENGIYVFVNDQFSRGLVEGRGY